MKSEEDYESDVSFNDEYEHMLQHVMEGVRGGRGFMAAVGGGCAAGHGGIPTGGARQVMLPRLPRPGGGGAPAQRGSSTKASAPGRRPLARPPLTPSCPFFLPRPPPPAGRGPGREPAAGRQAEEGVGGGGRGGRGGGGGGQGHRQEVRASLTLMWYISPPVCVYASLPPCVCVWPQACYAVHSARMRTHDPCFPAPVHRIPLPPSSCSSSAGGGC